MHYFIAQKTWFVHIEAVFVHFIWLCAQKVVPLQRFLRKHCENRLFRREYTLYILNSKYGIKNCSTC